MGLSGGRKNDENDFVEHPFFQITTSHTDEINEICHFKFVELIFGSWSSHHNNRQHTLNTTPRYTSGTNSPLLTTPPGYTSGTSISTNLIRRCGQQPLRGISVSELKSGQLEYRRLKIWPWLLWPCPRCSESYSIFFNIMFCQVWVHGIRTGVHDCKFLQPSGFFDEW